MKFRAPYETRDTTAVELLARAWPEATDDERLDAITNGGFRVDERVWRKPKRPVPPDSMCAIDAEGGSEPFGLPEGNSLSRGAGWIVVDKPVGMPGTLALDDPMDPILFLADMLGVERDGFQPVWPMPTIAGGPWLLALDDVTCADLQDGWRSGGIMQTWVAITTEFGVPRGQFTHRGIPVDYGATRMDGGLVEVQMTPQFQHGQLPELIDPVTFVLEALAAQDAPVLGDRERGGYMVHGGLRLRLAALYDESGELAYSWPAPQDWWPDEPVVPAIEPEPTDAPEEQQAKAKGVKSLMVSRKTLEILENQRHPWVLADSDTGGRGHFKPGTLVRLESKDGRRGPFALVDSRKADLAARVWSWNADDAANFYDEAEIRYFEAVSRRGALLSDIGETDLFRLVHSEADGLPGMYLDRVGPVVRATIMGGAADGFSRTIYDAIVESDPEMMVLEVPHREDVRRGELPRAKLARAKTHYVRPGERVVGSEDGLKFWLEPWEGIDTGFFADQRENRRQLEHLVEPGERWLNLFCHTGAFTVKLLDLGATCVSVDVSKRYLNWLDENLELNGMDLSANENVADDARVYLDGDCGVFDGIIVDPPTAASTDAGFWSVRKDYEDHLAQCFRALARGGTMLVCRNDRKRSTPLDEMIRTAAKAAHREVVRLEDAPPAPDYPRLEGFPEGDIFEAYWVFAD
jgi:23S rRNA (cytosine1962-C5)-methyltransferase